ncbi:MAG: indolepyruvate oxidoreductase subunit beta [Oscillospiraceae bacterium]|nr:indolepyruvate oxidoreductase subunit beta [Oscillospiraceae bacterium]MDD7293459.1 indolepyruvate oxidoreductase subunit beta [Clostridiaceae bacterium]MDY5992188.1 indolepyruvate oxidoreductase subunit beta [Oscillospiraceae bacterium]
METKNILIVGVGGQGTLLASKLMGKYFTEEGYDVKVSEVHGMSQRGGSVVTYVRFGSRVFSSVIEKGEADIILSFEQLESARWLPYLKKGGVLITGTQKIDPMPVIMGKAEYPENIIEKLCRNDIKVIPVDALDLALKAGSAKCANVVLLGAAVRFLGIDRESFSKIIETSVPPKTVEMNLRAFDYGYSAE